MVDDPLDKMTPDQLAAVFSRRLRQLLTADEIGYVIGLNKAQANPSICHSHDFIDANEVMLAACIELTGQDDWWVWLNVEKACLLWNRAWTIARTTEFAISGVESPAADASGSGVSTLADAIRSSLVADEAHVDTVQPPGASS